MRPDDNTKDVNSTIDISDESNESSPFIVDDKTYIANNSSQSAKDLANMQKNKSIEANKKTAKTAVQTVATLYGGPALGSTVSAINSSGLMDRKYEKIAKTLEKQSKVNPAMRKVQEKLNEADEDGTLDAAAQALSLLGSGEANLAKPDINSKNANLANNLENNQDVKLLDATSDFSNKRTEKKKSKLGNNNFVFKKFMQNPKMYLIILLGLGGIVLFVVLLSIILGGGAAESATGSFLDSRYDFTQVNVILTNSYTSEENKVILQNLSFDDFIMGATYAETYNNINGLKKEELIKLFKSYMIVARSLALSIGKYNNENMEIELQSGNKGIPYCDIVNGCDVISSGGLNTYVLSSYTGSFTGSKVTSIPPMNSEVRSILYEAYQDSKYLLLVPQSMNELLSSYTYGNPPYNQNIKSSWLSRISTAKDYEALIAETSEYKNYKIYDLESYATQYNYSNNTSYWWPIGSRSAGDDGLYSGRPITTTITSPYGYRYHPISGKYKFHSGIDIGTSCKSPIIATRSGVVKTATYNSGYGYYIDIDHQDGTTSRYAHITEGGILVTVGQTVTQGQRIALVGTTGASTGCHLHFEVRKNGATVNPLDYVSRENTRPKATLSSGYVAGGNNMQSVCLSLKKTGFSNNAIAGIMTNMHHESGFRLSALGDSGTSYGLCQWHNGRFTNLKNHCGNRINTVECQLDYLLYELRYSYKGIYNYLQTNNSAWDMTDYFCKNFERPANKNSVCPSRANRYAESYLKYVTNGCN